MLHENFIGFQTFTKPKNRTYLTRAFNCPSHGVTGDACPSRLRFCCSSYEIPRVSGLTICKDSPIPPPFLPLILVAEVGGVGAFSSSGGGVVVPSCIPPLNRAGLSCCACGCDGSPEDAATPANILAAAISASFRFPQAAGDGSGNLPRLVAASCSGALMDMDGKGFPIG